MLYIVCSAKQLTLRSFFFSASSFHSTHSAPPPPVPGLFDTDSDSDGSEEHEDDWLEDSDDAQPVARATSKMSATVINEVRTLAPLDTNTNCILIASFVEGTRP